MIEGVTEVVGKVILVVSKLVSGFHGLAPIFKHMDFRLLISGKLSSAIEAKLFFVDRKLYRSAIVAKTFFFDYNHIGL